MPDRFPDRAISFASPFPAQNGASNEVKNSQAPVAERPLARRNRSLSLRVVAFLPSDVSVCVCTA
jgi:hypothetical protein